MMYTDSIETKGKVSFLQLDQSQLIHDIMNQARVAQQKWRAIPLKQRLTYITQLRKSLVQNMDQWVEIFREETKKTPTDTLTTEILFTANAFRYYEKHAASILKTKRKPTPWQFFGQKSYVSYEPYGVVAVISPWNFPMQLSIVPVMSALIAGNSVILKPSEYTPRINQALELWISQSGLPEHVIQFAHGDGQVGELLIDAKPDKVFFTGGTFAGNKVYERAARHLIPCDLELGGNDAMIVLHDAHVERAAAAAVWGAFLHSGQVCISVERVYVHQSIAEDFLNKAIEQTLQLKQGLSEDDDLGGMTTQIGWEKVKRNVEQAIADGAVQLTGDIRKDAKLPFYPPTILSEVQDHMAIVQKEVFGPVLSVMTFDTEDEVIARVNQSPYGLNAYVFSRDIEKAKRLVNQLHVGNAYINDVIMNIANMHLPFGGVKQSGFGRYHGADGLHTFTQSKSMMVDRGKLSRQMNWFPYHQRNYRVLKKIIKWLYH